MPEPEEHDATGLQGEAEATASQEKYASYLNYLSIALIVCCTIYAGATVWGWLDDNTSYTMAEAIFTAGLVGLGYFVSIVAILKRQAVLRGMRGPKDYHHKNKPR